MPAGRAKVFVTRPIPQAGLKVLQEQCGPVTVSPHDRALARQEFLRAIGGQDAVLCMLHDRIDAEAFEAAGEGCKVFANMAVGYDNVDAAEATRRGVMVTNTPGVLTDATAELAWALLLATVRRIVEADRFFRSGRWDGWGPLQFLGSDLAGQTLGIVGAGRIGTAMGLKGCGFGMQVLYCDMVENQVLEREVSAKRVELERLLGQSDVVSIHVSLTQETRHLIDERMLGLMKPTAYLINTSRGAVVDEAALVVALREGRLGGAGLDVYENEPVSVAGLVELDNVVCVPHIGSATSQTRGKMAIMAAQNIVAALAGRRPANLVNPEVCRR